jgi:hypothetical protein
MKVQLQNNNPLSLVRLELSAVMDCSISFSVRCVCDMVFYGIVRICTFMHCEIGDVKEPSNNIDKLEGQIFNYSCSISICR